MKILVAIPESSSPQTEYEARVLAFLLEKTIATDDRMCGHWINICWKTWRALVGDRCTKVLRDLQRRGVIEINETYSDGSITKPFSMSYRLAARFRVPKWEHYPLRLRCPMLTGPKISLADDDIRGQALVRHLSEITFEGEISDAREQFIADGILRGRYWFKRDRHGRIHSSVTSLSKATRRLAKLAGEVTAGIDVRNCQPLIIGALAASPELQKYAFSTHFAGGEGSQGGQGKGGLHMTPVFSGAKTGDGIGDYLEVCEQGTFYEQVQEATGIESRDAVKVHVLRVLFAENRIATKDPVYRVIDERFPGITEFIVQAKADDHPRLACGCQAVEARIVVDHATELVSDVPVVTIHDGIRYPVSAETAVQGALSEAWAGIGLSPSFSLE